jgi:hypothetical protein
MKPCHSILKTTQEGLLMATSKYIWVEAGPEVGDRVAFRELSDSHPKRVETDKTGEAFVHAGNSPQQIGRTGRALQAIGKGLLVEVDAPSDGKKGKSAKGKSTPADDGKKPDDGKKNETDDGKKPVDGKPNDPPTT